MGRKYHAIDSHMPLTGQFQFQNALQTQQYPLLDAYITAKVKTFSIVLQMTHLSQGWFGNNGYFVFAGYPAFPRSFRAAIRWRFYD